MSYKILCEPRPKAYANSAGLSLFARTSGVTFIPEMTLIFADLGRLILVFLLTPLASLPVFFQRNHHRLVPH